MHLHKGFRPWVCYTGIMDDTADGDTNKSRYYETDPGTGRIEQHYTDDDFLNALNNLSTDNYHPTTGEIADELDCHRNTARPRLNDLADDGKIQKLESKAGFTWLPKEDTE